MSTLWTPGGERPIRKEPPATAGGTGDGGDGEPTDEEVRAQLAAMQEQLANTPAELIIANHAFGLFELAALHLSLRPPQLDQARLAIDALAGVVDALGSRLGEGHEQLSEGLSQLRLAYVQIHAATEAAGAGGGPEEPYSAGAGADSGEEPSEPS